MIEPNGNKVVVTHDETKIVHSEQKQNEINVMRELEANENGEKELYDGLGYIPDTNPGTIDIVEKRGNDLFINGWKKVQYKGIEHWQLGQELARYPFPKWAMYNSELKRQFRSKARRRKLNEYLKQKGLRQSRNKYNSDQERQDAKKNRRINKKKNAISELQIIADKAGVSLEVVRANPSKYIK